MDFLRKHRILIVLLCVAAIFSALRLAVLPLTKGDSVSYIDAARSFAGETVPSDAIHPARLLKPLPPLLIALGARASDGDYTRAFAGLSVVSYLFFVIAAWFLFFVVFRSDRGAAYGTLLLISAYPVLYYGVDLYVDMGAWALFVAALASVAAYVAAPSRRTALVVGIFLAVGILWKEYSVLAGASAFLAVVLSRDVPWRERILRLALIGILPIAVLLSAQWYVWAEFHFSYLDWFRIGSAAPPGQNEYTLPLIAKSLFGVLFLGWFAALAGLFGWRKLDDGQRRIFCCFAAPLLAIFLWGYVSSRLYFVVAPLGALLAVHGILTYIKRTDAQVAVVTLLVAGNLFWVFAADLLRPLVRAFFA